MGWRDKVKAARLPETTVKLVMRGDLQAEHERLVAEIEAAAERKAGSLAGKGTAALEKRLREIEAEAEGSVVEFLLRALRRFKQPGDDRLTWQQLEEDHPPRVTDGMMEPRDRLAGGYNYQTFPEAMVRASIISVDGDETALTDADWAELSGSLTDHQFDELVNAAWGLNQTKVNIPFWPGGSKQTRTTGAA